MSLNLQCEAVARAGLGEPAKREGAELLWPCPNHDDKHPSLSVNPKKDAWLCGPCGASGNAWQFAAFLAKVSPDDKPAVKKWLAEHGHLNAAKQKAKADGRGPCVATYTYTDARGNPVARKLRFEPGSNGRRKDFVWEHLEGDKWASGLGAVKTPLYRSAEIINEPFVVLTEGEKDADAGANIGLVTTTSGGVGSWCEDHGEDLRSKDVVIIAHADEPGRKEAILRATSLHAKAHSVRVIEFENAKDLAEWIERGGKFDALFDLWEAAPEWKPATGAEILDAVLSFVRRFVSLTESQARAVALWVAHTHAFDAANSTPYLAVNSAEKQSGKTRLLEVLRLLVCCEWFTGRVTAAVLTRKIDAKHPTLLLDESDAAFGGEKEYAEALRGILNTGYRRGGAASCCVGKGADIGYRDFSTFCPKAISGIGKLPDTVADRSITIRLKRARRGEVARFREREAQREGSEIAAKLGAWCAVNLEKLRQPPPDIPMNLSDRQADCCEPLLAVADLAGGDWPEATRKAIVTLCAEAQADDQSPGVRLLRDARRIFAEKEVDEIPSGDLSEALAQIETSPWGEWSKGKPISAAKLARLLKPFEVYPDRIGGRDSRVRGYKVSQFQDAFSRYLAIESVHPSTTRENSGDREDFKVSTEKTEDTSENAVPPAKNAGCGHLDTLSREYSDGDALEL